MRRKFVPSLNCFANAMMTDVNSLWHTIFLPYTLKNDENFNSAIKHFKEVLAFSKEFEEKYNKEFDDKLVTADELAKQEKRCKEFKEQAQANMENEK